MRLVTGYNNNTILFGMYLIKKKKNIQSIETQNLPFWKICYLWRNFNKREMFLLSFIVVKYCECNIHDAQKHNTTHLLFTFQVNGKTVWFHCYWKCNIILLVTPITYCMILGQSIKSVFSFGKLRLTTCVPITFSTE